MLSVFAADEVLALLLMVVEDCSVAGVVAVVPAALTSVVVPVAVVPVVVVVVP